MVRIAAFSALLILLVPAALCAQTQDEPGTWAFQPARDEFRPDALLDLRSLNEKQAGESGFVKVDADGGFVLGNGKPVRFWAVNTSVGREKPFVARPLWPKAEPDLAHHARFLAKRGVNMVRLHAHLNPEPKGKLTDFNQAERDWIWRTVAAMKKEGIYTTISPFWATAKVGPSWGIPGVTAEQAAFGLLFFDPTMQEGYKAWLKALYAEKNPYTGIPLAADPAVAIIQLQNEDSLLFWTFNTIQGEPRKRLAKLFGDFLKAKYGSLEKAQTAWGGAGQQGRRLRQRHRRAGQHLGADPGPQRRQGPPAGRHDRVPLPDDVRLQSEDGKVPPRGTRLQAAHQRGQLADGRHGQAQRCRAVELHGQRGARGQPLLQRDPHRQEQRLGDRARATSSRRRPCSSTRGNCRSASSRSRARRCWSPSRAWVMPNPHAARARSWWRPTSR